MGIALLTATALVAIGMGSAQAQESETYPGSSISVLEQDRTEELVHPETGQVLTAVLHDDERKIDLYVDGIFVRTISMTEARQLTEEVALQNPTVTTRSACGHLINGLAAANSALWLAAGATVPTGAGAAVTGTAGIVTSGILGVAGIYC